MSTKREQKLVDIAFQLALLSAEYNHGKSNEEIAAWAADQLRACGFPTIPIGMSWGALTN